MNTFLEGEFVNECFEHKVLRGGGSLLK